MTADIDSAKNIDQNSLPIQPKWLTKSTLAIIAGSLGIYIVLFTISFFSGDTEAFVYLMIYSGFSLLTLLTNFIYKLLFWKNYRYSLGEKYLSISQGIISKTSREIVYGSIQNILLTRDFLDVIFGLASVKIENSSEGGNMMYYPKEAISNNIGFELNTLIIPGLSKEDAQILKETIEQRIKNNPVNDLGM